MIKTPQPTGRRTSSHSMVSGILVCATLMVVATSTGCTTCCRSTNAMIQQSGCLTDMHGRLAARKAWASHYAKCYRNHCSPKDVRDGFIDGFLDVCNGGDGCPPMFAPEGNCMSLFGCRQRSTSAWFEGYPLGAVAAEKCGACRWTHHRVNPQLLACNQELPCNPGCEPCKAAGQSGAYGSPLIHSDQWNGEPTPAAAGDAMPVLQPGETLVPGSYQQAPMQPEMDVPEPAPATDLEMDSASAAKPHSQQVGSVVEPQTEMQMGSNEFFEADEEAPLGSGLVCIVKPAVLAIDSVEQPEAVKEPKTEGQIIEMATPIDWISFDESETPISTVNYQGR